MRRNKKAQSVIDNLGEMVVAVLVVAIVIGVSMVILAQVNKQAAEIDPMGGCANNSQFYNSTLMQCCKYSCNGTHCSSCGDPHVANGTNISTINCSVPDNSLSATANATRDTINAADDIPGWLSIIIIVLIGTILMGLIALFQRQTT